MTHLEPGAIVTGTVIEQRPFGVFVDIGNDEPAVVVVTMLEDEPSRTPPFPPVDTTVTAVFLGYSGPGRQPRLSMRPIDLQTAREGRWAS